MILQAMALAFATVVGAAMIEARAASGNERCSGRATGPWLAAGGGHKISIVVDGESCATAAIRFSVQRPDGAVILNRSASPQTMGFGALEPAKLDEAISFMVERMGDHRSNRMPDWPPRYPDLKNTGSTTWYETDLPRSEWLALRESKAPMLVIPLGTETRHYFVLDKDGEVIEFATGKPR
jgi:hypothetical protein